MFARNDADTSDIQIFSYDSNATPGVPVFSIGDASLSVINIIAGDVAILTGTSKTAFTPSGILISGGLSGPCQVDIAATVTQSLWGQAPTAGGANGFPTVFAAQSVGGAGGGGSFAAGSLQTQAGDINCHVGSLVSATGGRMIVRGGDILTNCATVSSLGGELHLRGGRGFVGGSGVVDSGVSFHSTPASYQGMQRGIFLGNAAALPTGNPALGGYLYVNAGALTYRGSGGTTTVLGPA